MIETYSADRSNDESIMGFDLVRYDSSDRYIFTIEKI